MHKCNLCAMHSGLTKEDTFWFRQQFSANVFTYVASRWRLDRQLTMIWNRALLAVFCGMKVYSEWMSNGGSSMACVSVRTECICAFMWHGGTPPPRPLVFFLGALPCPFRDRERPVGQRSSVPKIDKLEGLTERIRFWTTGSSSQINKRYDQNESTLQQNWWLVMV